MKIIDLTGLLISNKTMPKHIIFEEEEYCWNSIANDYICNDHDAIRLFYNQYNMSNLPLFLGKTIEILEEEKKIPEKLSNIKFENGKFYLPVGNKHNYIIREVDKVFLDKINEIIDYLDYLKSKGDE